ncbi:MAG TPA: DUF427 domain-containing protein [Acidimicrobiia bacterium]|nr:DUF427 domain-containing protein [Acidimicrobiia bacterium]
MSGAAEGHVITTDPVSARVTVTVHGETVADSTNARVLHETGLPDRLYIPRTDIAMDKLVPTETTSHCPFKGDAVYWSAKVNGGAVTDVAWSYPHPLAGREDITELVCFFDEKVDEIAVDGAAITKPTTPWSVQAEAEHP